MSDEESDEEASEPAVELGEGESVEGAPIARVASRLTWPLQRSEIDRKEGDVVVRTPDGPQTVSEVLDELETTYFERRQEFLNEVRETVGVGPVQTE